MSRAQSRRNDNREQKPGDRIGRHVERQKPRAIGPETEKGGMAERNNAGIAENEIERDRKQRENGNLVQDEKLRGNRK